MFGASVTLFTLLGFRVRADISWLFLALLVTWSLGEGVFPTYYPGLAPATYWWMGVLGALGLFASIVLHELSHSVVARAFGIPIRNITLFIFGGVAEMESEPPSPKAEFLMAMAGPAASAALAVVLFLLSWAGAVAGTPVPLVGTLRYLALINGILALFNLVPAFPLDGGRALRAALWYWRGDLIGATRMASNAGSLFGLALIVFGALSIVRGDFVGGLWWCLIGMFVRNAAASSYQQVITKRLLTGEPVSAFMTRDPVCVPPRVSLRQFIEEFVYGTHHEFFPVVDDGQAIGAVSTRLVKAVPRERWEETLVGQVMAPLGADSTVGPRTDAMDALALMNRTGNTRLVVVDRGRAVGILALKDMLKLLAIRMELEGEE
ncbi:MAG: site-2 protease family protein [Hyphomicrobiales bacterium]|nr:site-2 protease family protein [Hyphomicrobiales bacterium]MCP5371945.1 site-2 protease family protein [Hyphomicrobiales bacterium]